MPMAIIAFDEAGLPGTLPSAMARIRNGQASNASVRCGEMTAVGPAAEIAGRACPSGPPMAMAKCETDIDAGGISEARAPDRSRGPARRGPVSSVPNQWAALEGALRTAVHEVRRDGIPRQRPRAPAIAASDEQHDEADRRTWPSGCGGACPRSDCAEPRRPSEAVSSAAASSAGPQARGLSTTYSDVGQQVEHHDIADRRAPARRPARPA